MATYLLTYLPCGMQRESAIDNSAHPHPIEVQSP